MNSKIKLKVKKTQEEFIVSNFAITKMTNTPPFLFKNAEK